MDYNGIDWNDPFFRYTLEEKKRMSDEELFALMEESNEYVLRKQKILKESKIPRFNSIEEIRAYYHCRPLDEVINNGYNLFNTDD